MRSAAAAHLIADCLFDAECWSASPLRAECAGIHVGKAESAAAAGPPERTISVRDARACLFWIKLAGLDGERELLLDGQSLDVETVVLVLGLRQSNDRRLSLDGLTVTDDGVGDLEGNTSVVLLQILTRSSAMRHSVGICERDVPSSRSPNEARQRQQQRALRSQQSMPEHRGQTSSDA